MTRLATLAAAEARLLVRDWTVLVFAFVFPPFVMLILAGVFGTQPDEGYAMQRPDDYYVTASIGVAVGRSGDTAAGLIKRADASMYRAKRSGKNQAAAE